MGNDPGNLVDEDGGWSGWSAGAIGAVPGAVLGGVAGGLIANNNGGGFWGTLGGALGGAFVGAGLGYAGGESLFGGECINFWTNTRAFYSGVFGGTGNVIGGSIFYGHSALVPDVWGTIGGLIPNLNLNISLNLGSFASWVPAVSSTVKVVETLYEVIKMGSIQRDGFQEWPNYSHEFDLGPLPEGSSYRIEPPRELDANFNAYDGMPSRGPIGPGRHRVDVRVRTNKLVREQINYEREIQEAIAAGIDVQSYIENHERKIQNTIDGNNKSKIKIYRIDKIKREKSFQYLKILGIPLKFIRKSG